jgi:hypothetical protein
MKIKKIVYGIMIIGMSGSTMEFLALTLPAPSQPHPYYQPQPISVPMDMRVKLNPEKANYLIEQLQLLNTAYQVPVQHLISQLQQEGFTPRVEKSIKAYLDAYIDNLYDTGKKELADGLVGVIYNSIYAPMAHHPNK